MPNKDIPTVILCGGKGTRLKEETEFKPKPMVLVGERPILWHIMKIYAHYGYNRFILALGYKGSLIKEYFLHEKTFLNDFTLETVNDKLEFHNNDNDNFRITFVETGAETLTGERILKLKKYIDTDEFMLTYGDGVSDINIGKLVEFHRNRKTIGTITAVHPFSKYGLVEIDEVASLAIDFKSHYEQKPLMREYVNGGFMVFKKEALDYFDTGTMEGAFPKLIKKNQLSVYQHNGFWKGMDTYLEVEELNELWKKERPWTIWEKK